MSGLHANVGKHTQSVMTTDNLPGKLAGMDTPKYPASPTDSGMYNNKNDDEKC